MVQFADSGEVAVSAPGGRCDVCGNENHWRFDDEGVLWTSCPVCLELDLDCGPFPAVGESRDEAVRRDECSFQSETSSMLDSMRFAKEW